MTKPPKHSLTGAAGVAAFVLLLSACANLGMAGLTPRQYSAPLVVTHYDMNARFILARTADESNKLCAERGKRPPPAGSFTTGCVVAPNSRLNKSDRWLIIAVHPVDWNDQVSLANLGHEVLHGLGAEHE